MKRLSCLLVAPTICSPAFAATLPIVTTAAATPGYLVVLGRCLPQGDPAA